MSATSNRASPAQAQASPAEFFRTLEIDTRLLGMVVALVVIWVGFHLATGVFLSARNLWNLAVQTSVTAIVATGMVLVIVTRNIDLSVGSVLGFLGMVMAVVQVDLLPAALGLGHPLILVLALLAGCIVGGAIGALQGIWIAYARVPSFIVTLGGLLIWRGAAWWVTQGRTVAPMDQTFQILGGGISGSGVSGSLGETLSWVFGAVAVALVVGGAILRRSSRKRFGFPLKPIWAEVLVTGTVVALILGFVQVMNSETLPPRVAQQLMEAQGFSAPPEGGWQIARGIPVPVIIMIAVACIMGFIAKRLRFGRYIFAIGGNPDAAELGGINTRRVLLMVFVMMGILCAIAGAVQVARLNAGANSTGTLLELQAIAAAVIGGTSLAGGVGTILGAIIGALVMQSLQSGMVLLNIDTPLQQIVIGAVLVLAVWVDTIYQRRRK